MDARTRIVAALSAEDGSLRRAGLELVLDHVLSTRVDAWLDVEGVSDFLTKAITRDNSARVIEQHVLPGIERVHAALRAADETVGDAVSTEARATLDALVTNPRGPRFAWLQGALDRDKLRALIAPVVQELLISFASRIPLAGRDGGGSGAASVAADFVGRIGRGTGERLLNFGKSVADNLGVDIEARLRDAARDFSQGAVATLERSIYARLASPEAAPIIADLSRGVLERVLKTPMATILDDIARLPLTDAVRIAAPILEHDLARQVWQDIVRNEVQAVLAIEGQRTLGELLDQAGLLTTLRGLVVARGEPVVRDLFASPAFATWLDRLLQA